MPHDGPRYRAGDIVLADWRGDARASEPNKRRPAVVVEDSDLFARSYPNVIVVPMTDDARLVIPDLAVAMAPSAANGCTKACWAVAHLVTTVSKARLHPTESHVTVAELAAIRRRIAECVGSGS
jgi:mRNA-degrading endonuclease toxin of MazEF toxin-antitoxin module